MITILILGITLALDALSVSIAEGALVKEKRVHLAFKLATTFGLFQAGMAWLGGTGGTFLPESLVRYNNWIAFTIFLVLGLKMLKEAFKAKKEESNLGGLVLLMLGLATSIDAAAAGLTLPFFDVPVYLSLTWIGGITFLLCFLAALFGAWLKNKFKAIPLEAMGGVLLIVLASKSLLF